MERDELERIDRNLVESVRELARWQDGTLLAERDGALLSTGAGFMMNTALRTDPGLPAATFLECARDFFAERRRGYTLWVREHADADLEDALRGRDLEPVSEVPWMVLRKALPERRLPAGVELVPVEDEAAVSAVAEINADAYPDLGFPADECRAVYSRPHRLLGPPLSISLARVDGEAAATAMLLESHGIGGIYWVGTRRGFRGRGLAEACTRAVGNAAFARGARFAALHASPLGEPIYRRMGYETVSWHRWYLVPRA